jgi:hypothetical protein
MTSRDPHAFSAAVEGPIDEAVLRRVLSDLGIVLGPVFGKKGKSFLRTRIHGYNSAAIHSYWTVLIDLDHDADCAPALRQEWLLNPARFMCFRVAVREVESWLLADRERFARFIGVPKERIPGEPDQLENPKRTIIDLARRSRRSEIRRDVVPRTGSGREVGPGYTSRMIEFVHSHWRPSVAESHSDSMRRCRARLAACGNEP